MRRIAMAAMSFLLVIIPVTMAVAAATEAGSQVMTRQRNGAVETWIRTVDPAVPSSFDATDYRGPVRGHRDMLDETGQMMWETSHPTGIMNSVATSDDGSLAAIAVYLNQAQLQVYNGETGDLIYSKAGVQWIRDNYVAMSASGQTIAYSSDHFLYLMTPTDSTPVWVASFDTSSFGPVGVSRDGSHIIATEMYTSTTQDSVHVWCFGPTSATPLWVHAYLAAPLAGWYGVSFSGDGSRVAVTSNNRIFVYDPVSGDRIWDVAANNTQYPARLSGNGHVMTTGSNGGTFRVFGWDQGLQTYVQLWHYAFTGNYSNWATASAVSGDGLTVACGSLQFVDNSGSYAGYVAVFDTYGGGLPLWLSPTMYDLVSDVGISDNGLTIAATSWGDYRNPANPNIMVFDKYNSTPFFSYAHPGSPNALAINPAGTRIFAGGKAVHDRIGGNGGHAYMFSADLEGGTVSGTVTINGVTNRSGVTVEAQGQHRMALTDSSGVYHIYHIPAGTQTILAHKLGYTTSSVSGVVVTDGGTVNNVNFTLDTVGVAPSNLAASQAQLRSVHLSWTAMTRRGRLAHERDIRLTLGLENPVDACGPVAAIHRNNAVVPAFDWRDVRRSPLDDLDEPDSIRIYRGPTQGGPYVPITSVVGTATAYEDSSRVFPTFNYYYVATGLYANGESVYSNEAVGRLDSSYMNYNPVVPAMTHPVTFDGILSPQEWSDAVRIDASDVFGYDTPDPPGTAFMYLKYDDVHDLLLVAGEDHANHELDNQDDFGFYVDDDGNHVWSYNRPGSEGNYWIRWNGSSPTLIYRSLSGAPYNSTFYTFPNPQIGMSTSAGYVTMEVAIPMGFHHEYDIALYGPDRTPGVGFFSRDYHSGNAVFHGWWPQNVPSMPSNPEYFGDCSIPATLFVPPIPPDNITVNHDGQYLRVSWTDPTEGIDSLPLHQTLQGINIYRNGEFMDLIAPATQTYLDEYTDVGGWYDYTLAGFIPEDTTTFEGPRSAPVGAYAGSVQPTIDTLIQDDGTWESQYYVAYPYDGNRMAEQFDMPTEHSKVYAIQVVTNGTHSYGLAVAADDNGLPGAALAGPYTVVSPSPSQWFTFHIPNLEQPTVTGSFWVTLDWDPASPLDPYVWADTDGNSFGRSWYFSNATSWGRTLVGPGRYANWMIRAGVGDAMSGTAKHDPAVVYQFRLMANYPNPFNPETMIPFELAETGPASLTIYNLMGQKVVTLISGVQQAGYHVVPWKGSDDRGRSVASGLYLMRLAAGPHVATQKTMLIR